mmetsp:Transcript_24992/g.54346  ORF Transcript_24992/g.54346 Transcript_24992/m.54346 type:complete len:81 (-) Transcript_24992:1158-1400(-)
MLTAPSLAPGQKTPFPPSTPHRNDHPTCDLNNTWVSAAMQPLITAGLPVLHQFDFTSCLANSSTQTQVGRDRLGLDQPAC